MAPEPRDGAEARNGRARVAVAALFLSNGALFANLLPRFPEIKTDLAMSNAAYGGAVAAFSAGALMAGLTAAALIRRFGSARVALVTTVALAALVVVAGVASTPLMFAAALFVAGATDAITDVAQNVNGLRLQRNYGRSIIN
ncbi:MAG TPA: MFS transporter, partial [Mycobacterium sp.]|nr:MFS transporter [Mycobacterium sp.]